MTQKKIKHSKFLSQKKSLLRRDRLNLKPPLMTQNVQSSEISNNGQPPTQAVWQLILQL